MRRSLAVTSAVVLTVGLVGCGDDRPSPDAGGAHLQSQMAEVRARFLDVNEDVVVPWRVGVAADTTGGPGAYGNGCDDGGQRHYLATVSVAEVGDEDTWGAGLLGLLHDLGWDVTGFDGPVDPDGQRLPRLLSLSRSDDAAGSTLDVVYEQTGTAQRSSRGKTYRLPVVHYTLTAHTSCLPSG